MKIILTDDSQLILDRLSEMLCGFKGVEIVGSFKNGTESLKAIKTLHPHLVILDISMPGLTGLQVLGALQQENQNPKFIVLTFYTSEYYRSEAFRLGADYFFSKVDDFDKVAEVVDNLLIQDNSYSLNAV